ncbi:protein NIM1-INTERACTING 2 [Benincasa hispida]|uniref:protein NIM1-INTERACTING 2 n=1 Tax=Benincasa hispida TaxID=102211 RepID=UPI001901E3CD|nr:protein NIM1-INTERACTING 2 [Benincasa hispida]
MPFELFPASRSTDRGKRKREDDAGTGSQRDAVADRGKEAETATDEEVEEFFSILKRLHAATKYIEKIDGASRLLMGKRSKPTKSSEEEADEVEIRAEKIPDHKLDRNLDLDLNLEPACVESDDKTSRSQNLKTSCADSAADSCRK